MQPIVQSILQGGMDIVPTRLKNAVLRIVARSKHRSYYLPQREQQPNTSSHVSTALHQICFSSPVLEKKAHEILFVPAEAPWFVTGGIANLLAGGCLSFGQTGHPWQSNSKTW